MSYQSLANIDDKILLTSISKNQTYSKSRTEQSLCPRRVGPSLGKNPKLEKKSFRHGTWIEERVLPTRVQPIDALAQQPSYCSLKLSCPPHAVTWLMALTIWLVARSGGTKPHAGSICARCFCRGPSRPALNSTASHCLFFRIRASQTLTVTRCTCSQSH